MVNHLCVWVCVCGMGLLPIKIKHVWSLAELGIYTSVYLYVAAIVGPCISKFIRYLHVRVRIGSTRVYNLIQLRIFQVEHLNNFLALCVLLEFVCLCTIRLFLR